VTLWLLRHGPVDCPPNHCYGRADVPALVPPAGEIAARVAPALPHALALVSSPRARCLMLAQALQALRPDLRLHTDARIAEMDFGAWEGRAWCDIDRAEIDAWTRDFAGARAGGSGESTAGLMARVGAAYDAWQAGGQPALWVTHAGVMRAALLLQAGQRRVQRADRWPARAIGWGELIVLGA